jgi:F0F1-type ATP synthase membrane subunit b/b'
MSQVSDYTSYQNSLQRLRDSYETERADSRASNDEKLESVKARAEETIKSAKKDYGSRLEEERAQAREEVKKLKDDLYDQRGKSQSGESKEILDERKALSRYHDDIQKQSDQRIDQAKEYTRSEIDRVHQQTATKVEDAVAAQKKSHRQEVNELEGELKQYQS